VKEILVSAWEFSEAKGYSNVTPPIVIQRMKIRKRICFQALKLALFHEIIVQDGCDFLINKEC